MTSNKLLGLKEQIRRKEMKKEREWKRKENGKGKRRKVGRKGEGKWKDDAMSYMSEEWMVWIKMLARCITTDLWALVNLPDISGLSLSLKLHNSREKSTRDLVVLDDKNFLLFFCSGQ